MNYAFFWRWKWNEIMKMVIFLSWNCANYSSLLYIFRSFRMFENICHCDGWKCWRNRICNFQLLGRTRYRFKSNTGQIICTSLFSVFIENHLLVIYPWLLSSVKPTTFVMSEKVFLHSSACKYLLDFLKWFPCDIYAC